jgi:hypothetical protein
MPAAMRALQAKPPGPGSGMPGCGMGRPRVRRREGAGMMTEATIFIAAREKPTEAERAAASRGGTVDKTCGALGAMS